VTNYIGFVGGTPGKKANPKLSTIQIGWINQQGGSADIAPETTIGAQVATEYLNKDGGGIDGHPIQLDTCYIPDTVSAASTCGEEFANNSKVSVVVEGFDAIGNEALESAVAAKHKVMVFLIAQTIDDTYKPGFALFGDSSHVEGPWATLAEDLHVKKVALINEDTPGSETGVDITEAALKYAHIGVSVVNFDPSETDLTTPLEAADASSAGLIIGDVNLTDCSDLYLAVKQLGLKAKVAVNAPCATSQVATGDGGSLPNGWYYLTDNSFYENTSDPSGAAFLKVTKLFGESAWAADPWVSDAFGEFLTTEKWLTELTKAGKALTPANIATVAHAFKGPVPNGAPNLDCGKYAAEGAPAVCNDKVQFLKDVDGKFSALTGWVGPPNGFIVPKSLI
jgi:branched-chain amino acid transport system substrate-binding protein